MRTRYVERYLIIQSKHISYTNLNVIKRNKSVWQADQPRSSCMGLGFYPYTIISARQYFVNKLILKGSDAV